MTMNIDLDLLLNLIPEDIDYFLKNEITISNIKYKRVFYIPQQKTTTEAFDGNYYRDYNGHKEVFEITAEEYHKLPEKFEMIVDTAVGPAKGTLYKEKEIEEVVRQAETKEYINYLKDNNKPLKNIKTKITNLIKKFNSYLETEENLHLLSEMEQDMIYFNIKEFKEYWDKELDD